MGFLSFLKRGEANDTGDRGGDRGNDRGGGDPGRGRTRGGAEAVDDVQQLRLRARRRLIGAAVLVGIAVIVFPLLFETQPRPIPVDLPIDIPRKDGATPLNIPAPATQAPRSAADPDAGRGIITESAEQAAADRPVPPPEAPAEQVAQATPPTAVPTLPATRESKADEPARPARTEPKAEVKAEPKVEPKPERKPESRPERKPEPKSEQKPDARADTRSADAARAQALLEGRASPDKAADRKPEAAASGGRFIVQVGAYADGKAAQDVRAKVERLGLKTYTQAVETADGKRIRVRVGPFNSRDEADKVAAKVRGGGLSSAVLTL